METTKKVFDQIKAIRPSKLYLVADGPKTPQEKTLTSSVRSYLEEHIDWECNITKIYSHTNLGCAKRVQTGLDYVFENEEMAIILEDDTLPDPSFFNFCEELLERYKDDQRVAHISGCNLHTNAVNFKESYCFSSIVNIWGWATWKRAWIHYDINMPSWVNQDKDRFVERWFSSKTQCNGMKKMFELHCNNSDPWAWSYQWIYCILSNNGLSIVPSVNLVSNLGIGPNATNTKSSINVEIYPSTLEPISFPLKHPNISRNTGFETKYYLESQLPLIRRIKNRIKSFF